VRASPVIVEEVAGQDAAHRAGIVSGLKLRDQPLAGRTEFWRGTGGAVVGREDHGSISYQSSSLLSLRDARGFVGFVGQCSRAARLSQHRRLGREIALTGLQPTRSSTPRSLAVGGWTGGPRSTWQRSGPTLVWKEPDEGVEGVRHGHPIDRSRGGAPARWWGLGILPLA
jgi:hypothetical protein